jgi:hypothetical protein
VEITGFFKKDLNIQQQPPNRRNQPQKAGFLFKKLFEDICIILNFSLGKATAKPQFFVLTMGRGIFLCSSSGFRIRSSWRSEAFIEGSEGVGGDGGGSTIC